MIFHDVSEITRVQKSQRLKVFARRAAAYVLKENVIRSIETGLTS